MPKPSVSFSLFLDSRIGSVVEKRETELRAVFIHVRVLRREHDGHIFEFRQREQRTPLAA